MKIKSQQENTPSNQGEGFFRQKVGTLKFLLSEARTSHTLRPRQVRTQVSHQLPLSETQTTRAKESRTNQSSPRDREYFETEAVLLKFRADFQDTFTTAALTLETHQHKKEAYGQQALTDQTNYAITRTQHISTKDDQTRIYLD